MAKLTTAGAAADGLGAAAAETAMRAAVEYLRAHGLKADTEALVDCLKANVRIRLPEALADAKEAIDCGMPEVAIQTFSASLVLAGIDAAKEAGYPASWAGPNG